MGLFGKLFKEVGTKDVITLFHAPKDQASIRVHTLLKQAASQRVAHATVDQASSHSTESKVDQPDFTLEVVEDAPTPDQLINILEYLGPSNAGNVIQDASSLNEAKRKFKESVSSFRRPITVAWNSGQAVVGDNESEILKLVKSAQGTASK